MIYIVSVEQNAKLFSTFQNFDQLWSIRSWILCCDKIGSVSEIAELENNKEKEREAMAETAQKETIFFFNKINNLKMQQKKMGIFKYN